MIGENMKTKKALFSQIIYFDLFAFISSAFIYLYYNPSEVGRIRLVYIGLQVLICVVCVFSVRCVFGIYKKIGALHNPKYHFLNLKLFVSDFIAGIMIYIIQLLIPDTPPVRISFVQVAIIIGFNLLIGLFLRSVFQCIYEWCNGFDKEWTEA